jgi:GNAT superfamily N-acetyltransferase
MRGVGAHRLAEGTARDTSCDIKPLVGLLKNLPHELVEPTRSYGGNSVPGWWDRIRPHSLGWVTARLDDWTLVGFVNVAWDGCDHSFLLDTKVRSDQQRRGIGTELVRIAARHAKEAGCEWMEVDFDDDPFYYNACGFVPTKAGFLRLN